MQSPVSEEHNLSYLGAFNTTEIVFFLQKQNMTKCTKCNNVSNHTLSMSQPCLVAECEMWPAQIAQTNIGSAVVKPKSFPPFHSLLHSGPTLGIGDTGGRLGLHLLEGRTTSTLLLGKNTF